MRSRDSNWRREEEREDADESSRDEEPPPLVPRPSVSLPLRRRRFFGMRFESLPLPSCFSSGIRLISIG